MEGRLVPVEDLRALLQRGANFETWSRLLVERLDELLPNLRTTLHRGAGAPA
jgi:hypothetical protein